MSPIARSRIRLLVAPATIVFAVLCGILISPYSHLIPGFGKQCGLRQWTGYPCLACGGTRCVQALAEGDVLAALKFNPLVFLAICAALIWLAISVWRAIRLAEPSPDIGRRSKVRAGWWLGGLALLAVLNWCYLVRYLPA